MRRLLPALAIPLLAACATVPQVGAPEPPPERPRSERTPPPSQPAPPPTGGFRAPQVQSGAGLQAVIERDADTLTRLFGPPRLDVREGDMRKLQFTGRACVLDVFLYPLRPDATPVATSVQARRPSDGRAVDGAACIAALRRR